MADVVLVQPLLGGYSKIIRPVVPLSLVTLAAPLVDRGYKVSIVDLNRHKDWETRLRRELAEKPACVGVTAKTGSQIISGIEVSRVVREVCEVPVVWGGIHPSLLPDQTAAHPFVDVVVVGEGDITLLALVEALRAGAPLDGVKGLRYSSNGKVVATPVRDFCNLDELPDLPYELVEIDSGLVSHNKGGIDVDMESSRGCPMRCTFCYNHEFNRSKWRAMSATRTIERMEHAVSSLPVSSFHFVDDNFFLKLSRAREIVRAVRSFGLPWEVEGIEVKAINRLSDEDLGMLRTGRMRWLKCGVGGCIFRVGN